MTVDCKPLAPVYPVLKSRHPIAREMLEAVAEQRELALFYQGGTTPGLLRYFSPHALFQLQVGGPIYVAGRCANRNSLRTLRIDRIRLA